MRIHRLYFFLLILIIHSCDQGEIAIEVEPGEILIDQVDLNSDYRYQIYYNLSTSSITSTNIKTNWDLAFENGEDGFLEGILSRIPEKDFNCVEFGAWDGQHLSNTYHLISEKNFKGVLIEGEKERFFDLKS